MTNILNGFLLHMLFVSLSLPQKQITDKRLCDVKVVTYSDRLPAVVLSHAL